jgi:hypothetical protein
MILLLHSFFVAVSATGRDGNGNEKLSGRGVEEE